jgi:hypothetical protein
LAIEHRDGSGPAILNPTEDGKGELMTYLSMDDLKYVDLSTYLKKGLIIVGQMGKDQKIN